MFADKTLTPKEAVRLCALGTLAEAGAPRRYSELANETRHFIARLMGPSLDLMGTSIELLLYEGLAQAVDGQGMEDNALIDLTDEGRDEFHRLMTANLRAATDLSKLVTALKFRFLPLLEKDQQRDQAEVLLDTVEVELHRLEDLRKGLDDGALLSAWLDHDIAQLESRLSWIEAFRSGLG